MLDEREKIRRIFRRSCTLRTGPRPMKSRSNLESFEIVRISAGSVTTTTSVIPGKYVRFMLDLRFACVPIWGGAFTNGALSDAQRRCRVQKSGVAISRAAYPCHLRPLARAHGCSFFSESLRSLSLLPAKSFPASSKLIGCPGGRSCRNPVSGNMQSSCP